VGRDDDHWNFVSRHHAAGSSKNLGSGADSHGREFLPLFGSDWAWLARLLPRSETIVFPDAGHQMWLQDPEACHRDVEKFLADFGIR